MPRTNKAPSRQLRGRVVWFDDAKGFGFLCPEGKKTGEGDVFVHFTAIAHRSGRRTLLPGQAVEFEAIQGRDRLMAHNVRVVEP